ncbi:plastocyanin-like domain protein [Medicago truncatula]|uniref:Plastocyanin-like domain protein n=1 Tax=Medicago truncatula TaxID=3880 RepID=G7IEC2_MEDTR|nr:plastocyanin-like domain protein [Medicago truncatula]
MALILVLIIAILINLSGDSTSAVYRVGDTAGLSIFSYHKQYHDVMEVSHQDYIHCNINSAKAFYHSGSDSINLTNPGDFYFICSKNGHCQAGQKLHIKVHYT